MIGEWEIWTITGPSFLQSRSNRTLQDAPLIASNVSTANDSVVQMRQGFDDSETITGGDLGGTSKWIGRHLANDGSEEGWAASDNGGTAALARRTTGGAFTAVTFSDTATTANLVQMQSATQNGKLFLAYNSNVNRLHVWDGTTLRRVGLQRAENCTAATAGGAGLTFNRWYRQRNVVQVGGVTVRRSEPSPTPVNVSIVDDSGVTITKGTASGDGETHWEVEASSDSGGASDGVWRRIATTAVGTATATDNNAAITSFSLTDTAGLYYTPPSCKYILSDGAVLLMAGAWESSSSGTETAPFQNRVWFTRPLGSTDISDDESITTSTDLKNWIDIGDTGPITGLAGPYNGDIIVFKGQSVWKLVPTGDLNAPYRRVPVHNSIGALDQVAIAEGTLKGLPAIYFVNKTGVWVLTMSGFDLLSDPIINDLVTDVLAAPDATTPGINYTRLMFNAGENRIWLHAQTTDHGPYKFFFDTQRIGWTGQDVSAQMAATEVTRGVMLNGRFTIVGGTSTSRILTQRGSTTGYLGYDVDTQYTSYAKYRRAFAVPTGHKVTLGAPTVWYRRPTSGNTCTVQVQYQDPTTGTGPTAASFTMAANGPITTTSETLEGHTLADVTAVDVSIALTMATSAVTGSQIAPAVDVVQIPYMIQEPLPR